MKKEKFGFLNFDSIQTLSREEMKNVTGGYGEAPNPFKLCVKWMPMTSTFDIVRYNASDGYATVINHNVNPASSSLGPC